MIPVWKLNAAQVLGLGLPGRRDRHLAQAQAAAARPSQYSGPIAGGMVFALAALALHGRVVNLEADTTLRDLLMVAFMTTIGLSARWN